MKFEEYMKLSENDNTSKFVKSNESNAEGNL